MLSMTGHGVASLRDRGLDIEVEVRSLNHRFFNLKMNLPSSLGRQEAEVERIVRSRIGRGSVLLTVSMKSVSVDGPPLPDAEIVRGVYRRLSRMQKKLKIPGEVTMEALLNLPHLWVMEDRKDDAARIWPRVRRLVEEALNDHNRMRVREGKGIRRDFLQRLARIEEVLGEIGKRAPLVLGAYQKKLLDRVNMIVAKEGLEVAKSDVIREVAIFADRSDINEEVQRLRSHCRQFRKIIGRTGQIGRKLDFLTQEMAREANTLAAKGGDSRISALAVEIKAEIEKIKEQTENVE